MKNPVRSKGAEVGVKSEGANPGKAPLKRSWLAALTWSGALAGGAVILSAVVNPLFGRFVHWDWMAGLAPTLFVLLTLSMRRRWM